MNWTWEQATAAKLTGKDNWKNYPRAMLRSRVIAEAIRAIYPAALGGMLLAEEAQDLPLDHALPERHMGAADVVPPAAPAFYPVDQFLANLPKWERVIQTGRKTADEIIAMAQSKHPLSEAQKTSIRAIKPIEDAPTSEPVVTYAQVASALHKAADMDALDTAADLIGAVADATQRAELAGIYDNCKTAITE